ncbi:MAG: glycosyltransferase family 2 protein [Candidatus Magasanikbacteria bacterium]|nr:glycosyltransferase family 2 protein [Candidatus Magasanikbacteria bacterium]
MYIIIPAYNEEKNIGNVLAGLIAAQPEAKIVVVDDGSEDNTAGAARQVGASVIRHIINRGQGAALATGTEYALDNGANFIVHFDADGQFEAKDVAVLIEPIKTGRAEVVLGSRFLSQANNIPFFKKYFILAMARVVNFLFTGLWLSDAHNGLRAFSRRAAENIKITQDRMAHNSEIVAQLKKSNLKFVEVPVTVKYHRYGQGFFGGLKIIKDLILQKII